MTQPTVPANSLDASSPQDNAWNCLLALETQVQTTQTSLTLHTTELAGLCQTMDTISHSLQMLLERLSPTPVATPTPPTPPETNPAPRFNVSTAPHTKIPCPALSDTYDGDWAGGEHFLQSCVTYIQLPVTHPLSAVHASSITPPPLAAAQPLPPGIPMEVDASRQHASTPLLCCRCKKPGHFACYCPQGLEVHYLSSSEQEELLLQLLAAKDASGDPSPDASLVDRSSEVSPAGPSTEQKEDF
ncbi:hypothetical protein C0995_013605 [Termitomyces sp. Mi166|nr:hypothetical protein C0995_013605 [Termitomyces sp. Mi166\